MTRIATALAVPLLAALAACSAAQDAVSNASSSAQQAAEQKAKELAVQAFRAQVCAMTADGTLSPADLAKLRSGLDTAAAAGVPTQVVDAVRPLVEQGGTATKAQVLRVHQQACAG